MDTDSEENRKKGELCPFAPYITGSQRSIFCVGAWCKLWDKKKKDCGLKK